ncbi:MAG: hypothetical protein EOM24_32980, partial [Chloroflexia bacterium]|nr:hypothetical protein [Chloroflexia bacterium]
MNMDAPTQPTAPSSAKPTAPSGTDGAGAACSTCRAALAVALPRRLLIIACTATQRPDVRLLPALDRYDGPSFRVVRRWLSDHP